MTNAIEWWLKPRTFISLSFWKLEGVDQDVCMVGFWWGPSSWLVDGSFLTVSSCGWEIPHVEALWCLSLTHYWLGNFYRNQHLGLAIFLLASQKLILSSVQFTHSVMSESLRPHGLYSTLDPAVHGILQVRILEWVAISFSRRMDTFIYTWLSPFAVLLKLSLYC